MQFAVELRKAGYRGRMVSFDPLDAAHAKLLANARGEDGW